MSTVTQSTTTPAGRNRQCFMMPDGLLPVAIVVAGLSKLPVNAVRGANQLRRNYAGAEAAQFTIQGVPVYAAKYAELDAQSYASLVGVKEPTNATIVWVGEIGVPDVEFATDSSYRPHLAGWGRNSGGFGIFPSSGVQMRATATFGGAPQSATLSGYATGALYNRRMFAARVESGTGIKLFDLTANTSAKGDNVGARSPGPNNEDFHVGSAYVGVNMVAGKGKSKFGMAVMFDSALTDAQITGVVADWMRSTWSSLNAAPADF